MPELPEVETIKKAIEKGIGNADILNIEMAKMKFFSRLSYRSRIDRGLLSSFPQKHCFI